VDWGWLNSILPGLDQEHQMQQQFNKALEDDLLRQNKKM
jgi:hypothetical protein